MHSASPVSLSLSVYIYLTGLRAEDVGNTHPQRLVCKALLETGKGDEKLSEQQNAEMRKSTTNCNKMAGVICVKFRGGTIGKSKQTRKGTAKDTQSKTDIKPE